MPLGLAGCGEGSHLCDHNLNYIMNFKDLFWVTIWIVIVAVAQATFIWVVARWAALPSGGPQSLLLVWIKDVLITLFFLAIIGGIYEAKFFFQQTLIAIDKSEKLKKEQARQRLDTLKNKVNPHFLFNALTSLSALINEDPSRAEQFVDELSKVYRYLLRNHVDSILPLDKVCHFAESYCFLLKNRFEEDAFEVVFDPKLGDFATSMGVPALSFQHAIEWLARTQHPPLRIHIGFREARVVLACGYQPKSMNMPLAQEEWQQLQTIGAVQSHAGDRLEIHILLQPISVPS